MPKSKNNSHNPIFSKLNKIFEPKTPSEPQINQFTLPKLVQSVNIGHQQVENQLQAYIQIDSLRQKGFPSNLITAETEPSCVFFLSNPSIYSSKINHYPFDSNALENNENYPFSTKIETNQNNKNSRSISNLLKNEKSNKYFYQNHKLKHMSKPFMPQISQKQPYQNFIPERLQNQIPQDLSYIQSINSSCPFQCPHGSQCVTKMLQLQQKIQYYQKMQQFYLNQIETYRQDKQTLEWKLKLIVDELLFITMKDKLIGSSDMKPSHSMILIKQSKELVMSKIHQLNFSRTYEQLIAENKQNLPLGSNIKTSTDKNFHLNFAKPYTPHYSLPELQPHLAFDLQASSQYISSFLLENVTLVESQAEEDDEDSQQIALKERIIDSPQQTLGQPHFLSFA